MALRVEDRKPQFLFAIAALAVGGDALFERRVLASTSAEAYLAGMPWTALCIATAIVALSWYITIRTRSSRRWPLWVISGLAVLTVVLDFAFGIAYAGPVDFTTRILPWGEQVAHVSGATNPLRVVGDLVLIVSWLPLPEESHSTGAVWLVDLWVEYSDNIIAVIIGLLFSIMYWIRSNTLMTALDRTDGVHTGLSIASVFFLLLLLYIVRVSAEVAAPSRRAGESIAVTLIGIAAGAAWWWARRKGLVREGITKEEMLGVQIEAFAEPMAALVTLPFAYVGELAWNLAWFA